jgi:hypothetical protein
MGTPSSNSKSSCDFCVDCASGRGKSWSRTGSNREVSSTPSWKEGDRTSSAFRVVDSAFAVTEEGKIIFTPPPVLTLVAEVTEEEEAEGPFFFFLDTDV